MNIEAFVATLFAPCSWDDLHAGHKLINPKDLPIQCVGKPPDVASGALVSLTQASQRL
jgi:hypothetical protein